MLIEQIIEFELRGPGPFGRTCTPITGYFHDITKISNENRQVDYHLLLNYYRRQCTLLPLPQLNHLQKTNARFLTCFGLKLQVKRRLNKLNLSNWH